VRPGVKHQYVAEIVPEGGPTLSTPPLDVDWTPAIEWAHFQDVRRGAAALASAPKLARIRPRWDSRSGHPYVDSIEVAPWSRDAGQAEEIPLQYMAAAVRCAVTTLVAEGRIREGAQYTWRICAFDAAASDAAEPEPEAFAVEDAPDAAERLAVRRLDDVILHAVHYGPVASHAAWSDFPVLFARSVFDEAAAAACAAGELEAGGVLLGRLWRDADSRELIAEVTAQVPAREALADEVSLRFTPATWQAVRAAIALRRAGERPLGWYHSHPKKIWACHGCPPERRARCPSNAAIFSAMDVQFHRTAFQGAVNVALLLSFHDDPAPRFDLFGWKQGLIAVRDYYVLEKARDD
jgi:proteasome lid subunit RPN8/RPN11